MSFGSERYILFNALGATALFTLPFSDQNDTLSTVEAFDFGKPVIDFCIHPDTASGLIYVLLDANYSSQDRKDDSRFVHIVQLSRSGQLSPISTPDPPIITTLNSSCLIQATPDEIQKLELYNDLVSMPKSSAEENHEENEDEKGMSKRSLGRLKNKKLVKEQRKRVEDGGGEGEGEEETVKGHEAKKVKTVEGES